ncbi:MAG: hypothetical protein AAGG01_00840 [Planctomycetota bacterium]
MIACKVCDKGQLLPTKLHRLNAPAVVLGWLLIVLSCIGFAQAARDTYSLASSPDSGTTFADEAKRRAEPDLITRYADDFEGAGIPHSYLTTLAEGRRLSSQQRAWLSVKQNMLIGSVEAARGLLVLGAKAAPVIAETVVVPLIAIVSVTSILLALFGSLLVMKKRVLQCTHCGAVVAAS